MYVAISEDGTELSYSNDYNDIDVRAEALANEQNVTVGVFHCDDTDKVLGLHEPMSSFTCLGENNEEDYW